MTKGNSLINLGDLSKPATVLVEKISDAIGGYYKPYQIKRVAKAEAEAEIIKAQAQIEVTDLQRRALIRFVAEEARRQENIEQITKRAFPLIEDTAKPENMENDWVANFFDKCRIVSDEEMQSLWARVLAGEANAPGTYSRRTVNFLSSLDRADAELFTSLCGFVCFCGTVIPLVFDVQHSIYNSHGINFSTLSHLDDIGLVSFDNIAGFKRTKVAKVAVMVYYGTVLTIEFQNEVDNDLEIGKVLLTKTGQQLADICGSTEVAGFQSYIIERLAAKGLLLSSPYPRVVVPNTEHIISPER